MTAQRGTRVTHASMRRPSPVSGAALALAASLALSLAACSSDHGNDGGTAQRASASRTANPPHHGALVTPQGRYEFTPTTCAIHQEGGEYDIEVAGPGTAPDGEVFYFQFSSTGNHIGLELGADGPFNTVERSLAAGRYVTTPFEFSVRDACNPRGYAGACHV